MNQGQSEPHRLYRGDVTFCKQKGGRVKVVEGRCGHCGAEVTPYDRPR